MIEQFCRKTVFLLNHVSGPAVGAIKFYNEGQRIFDADLKHTVLITVELKNSGITAKTKVFDGIENTIRRQV